MTQIDKGTIQYRDELLRKAIHLSSLSIPVTYYFITRELALKILIPVSLFSLILDISRYFLPSVGGFINNVFGFMLREHEKDTSRKNLSGATYVFLSAVICIFLLPKVFMITAFSVLIVSDTAAALIGRKFGRHRFLSKSLEGTLAFFISACLVVILAPKISDSIWEYMIGFVAVAIGAIAENISYGWADDNLSIPLSVGLAMWAMYMVFLPGMPLTLSNVPF